MAVPEGGERRDTGMAPTQSLSLCADLQSKLMLLDYEQEYCAPNDTAPFPPAYFAAPSASSGLQFQHFVGLASYLGDKSGHSEVSVDRFDDPTAAVSKLSTSLHEMGFVADFPPIKLKPGWGEPVCRVLNFLSDRALKAARFSFVRPEYPTELLPEASDSGAAASGGDDAAGEADDSGEVDDEVEVAAQAEEEALYTEASTSAAAPAAAEVAPKATVDRATWETEVERMAPRLRARPPASGREWRSHLEQTARHNATVTELLSDAGRTLSGVNADVSAALQRVQDKEKYINATLSTLLGEHSKTTAKVSELEGEHGQRTSAVASLTSEIGQLTDELEDAKARMDEHGSSMTDQSPLVRIKTALGKLRAESRALDLRVGVTGHSVMQRKLKSAATQAAGAQGGEGGWEAEDDDDIEEGEDEAGEVSAAAAASTGRRRHR